MTKPVPNFTRLDPGRPEIAILMDAMLRARDVVAARSWSASQEPTSCVHGFGCADLGSSDTDEQERLVNAAEGTHLHIASKDMQPTFLYAAIAADCPAYHLALACDHDLNAASFSTRVRSERPLTNPDEPRASVRYCPADRCATTAEKCAFHKAFSHFERSVSRLCRVRLPKFSGRATRPPEGFYARFSRLTHGCAWECVLLSRLLYRQIGRLGAFENSHF
jgi:hypothetical protein